MPGTCLMKKKHIPIILIVIPALVIVALITFAILRVRAWIYTIQPPAEVYSEKIDAEFGEGSYDVILPLMDENGFAVKQDVKKILVFGNDPFANIPDSGSSMAAMLARKTGADVINCAVSGSYMCQSEAGNVLSDPMDVFTPYYMSVLTLFPEEVGETFDSAQQMLGSDLPPEFPAIRKALSELDLSTVDLIVFMYDLTDFYMDHPLSVGEIEAKEDTTSGNLRLAVNLFEKFLPDTRIICMSPYYNAFTDKNGDPESAELHQTSEGHTPSDFALSVGGAVQIHSTASFIDNYFGSINEDNYEDYLTDGIHLNEAGKELLTDRLVYAIKLFDREETALNTEQ